MKKLQILLLTVSLAVASCSSFKPERITVLSKRFVAKHIETKLQDEFMYGTLWANQPVDYSFPDLYLLLCQDDFKHQAYFSIPKEDFEILREGNICPLKPDWKKITMLPKGVREEFFNANRY